MLTYFYFYFERKYLTDTILQFASDKGKLHLLFIARKNIIQNKLQKPVTNMRSSFSAILSS
jgi:hypothetical protein